MRFASILILLTLLPLLTFGVGPSLTTHHLELITTKLSNQDITITPTGTGDLVLKDYNGVLKASSGTVSAGNIDLSSEVTGILGIVNGGVPEPGANGQILTLDVGIPKWLNPPVSTTLDTKGQIQGYSTENASLGPCTDDQILVYDAVEATGWKCSALPSSSPTTTQGDLILRGAANDERLPIGIAGKILTSNGTSAAWDDAPAGAAKIWNIIDDSSFEKGTYGTCSSAGSAVTSCAAIDRTTQIKPIDKKIFKIDADTSDTLTWTHNIISSDYANTKMLAGCQVSADAATSNVTIKALVDDVEQWNLDVPSDGVERDYYFPTVGGDTDFDIVVSGTAGDGDTIKVDNCYLGRVPIGYIQDVSQAHFVGSVHFDDTGCVWSRTSATYGTMTATSCTSDTPIGSITVPTPNTASITIPNARTDGTYHVETQGLLYNYSNTGICHFSLSTSSNHENQGVVWVASASDANRAASSLAGDFKFSSSGDKSVNIIAANQNTGTECRAHGNGNISRKWSVHFFPDSTNSIVQQEKELTAKTANVFGAEIAGDGVVTGDSYNFINGDCTVTSTSLYTCQLNDMNISNGLLCSTGILNADKTINYGGPLSASQITFLVKDSGVNTPSPFDITCIKHDADLNKSIKVDGHFLASQIKGLEIKLDDSKMFKDNNLAFSEAERTVTTSTFGSLSGSNKWTGGVLAPNGKIYGIPHNSTEILEIDPVAKTTSTFGSLTGTGKWVGGVLAPNGKIYGIPHNSTEILEIDPVAKTTSTFGSLTGTIKWFGGVLAPNGKIYGIPFGSTEILEIDFKNRDGFKSFDSALSPYYNKF